METTKTINIGKKEENTKDLKIQKLERAQIIAIVVSIILGTILHFLYKWTGANPIIASFSAVNESVWEHLKLVFFPMTLVGIIEYLFIKEKVHNYIEAKTIGIFSSICFIIVTFFTYTGIIGTNFLILDILIFILSIILGEYIALRLMKRKDESDQKTKLLASAILIFLLVSFVICTYIPPEVNLFRDPVKENYGIE